MSKNKTSVEKRDDAENQRTDSVDEIVATRPARVPVDGNRDILTVQNKEKGYVYYWFKDVGTNIARQQAAWWEHVTHAVKVGETTIDTSSENGKGVISYTDRDGTILYLMRILEEYYDEDKARSQKVVDENEATMVRELNSDNGDGRYGHVR
jgi:hypothetical protein